MNRLEQTVRDSPETPLLGTGVYRYDPAFIEIAGLLGFRAVWIEMEHAPLSFSQAEDLCRLAQGLGLIAMIRIPDATRENVLRVAECGPDIIDLPMANSSRVVEELVRHARYSPDGERGYFSASRAERYGLCGSITEERDRINRELCLMIQLETGEAVAVADDLCAVPGVDAVFLGPGDLSASMGRTGETNHPDVLQAADHAIAAAKARGKLVAMACPADEVKMWAAKGLDLAFCASDVACLRRGAKATLEEARSQGG